MHYSALLFHYGAQTSNVLNNARFIGGTEANNLALKACLLKAKTLTSAFEHASVLQSLDNPELELDNAFLVYVAPLSDTDKFRIV
jgi:cysteine sulfinate desulfinase/cysteine desulfurase-like protein